MRGARLLYLGVLVVALAVGLRVLRPLHVNAGYQHSSKPVFRVDPFWPKPLPATVYPTAAPYTPNDSVAHRWVAGEIAGSCTDQYGNVYTFNRGWEVGIVPPGSPAGTAAQGAESGAINGQDASASAIPSPPIVAYDKDGRVVNYFGDPTLIQPPNPSFGAAAYLPHGAHGCFVDYQGNLWVGGNGDGVVQKYSPSNPGSSPNGYPGKWTLQIGTHGMCDGSSNGSAVNPTCNETSDNNTSHTLLNEPADIAVDPEPDPITGKPGDIYIADGYGNHRVVVFDANGNYLRQWGQACTTDSTTCPPGYFGATGGGHPHCVVLGNDGEIYVCDRPDDRIQVFNKKTCAQTFATSTAAQPVCIPDRIIDISNFPTATPANQAAILKAGTRACDLDFWPNVDFLASMSPTKQDVIVDVDLGNDNTWLLDKASGMTFGALGRCGLSPCPGHNAGEFAFGHTTTVNEDGDIVVAETITGRRIQRFVRVDEDNHDRDNHDHNNHDHNN